MINLRYCFHSALFLSLFLAACGSQESASDLKFQTNAKSTFVLTDVFKGEGALEEAWNATDGKVVNSKLNEMIIGQGDEFENASFALSDLLMHDSQPVANMLGTDMRKAAARLIDPKDSFRKQNNAGGFYTKSGEHYKDGFYSLLDQLSEGESQADEQYANEILHKIISYYILPENNTPSEINEDMQELIDNILDDDFHGDFTDLTEGIAKFLIRSDYSLWVDGNGVPQNYVEIDTSNDTDLQLGNVVKGVNSLMMGLNELMINDESRELIHSLIWEAAELFDPDPESDRAGRVKDFICNLEDQFTTDGASFTNNPIYNTDNNEIFSGVALHEWIRDVLPPIIQYLMRGDRPNSLISDKANKKVYPVDILIQNLKRIEWDTENARIEESVYDLLRFDLRGRDRVNDPDASHASFLENLIFFSALGANFGFDDGGVTGEINDITDPNFNHGHGEGVGKLTLNDVLFSMKTTKTMDLLGMYDLAFAGTNKDHIFRSSRPFNKTNRNDYKFNYDQNYATGLFLSGTPGDMGDPDGGGNPLEDNGEPVLNAYRPYCPTGVKEDNIALNTMSASMRSAWRGEGPYYYAPENPPTVDIDGNSWEIFYTPSGKIYSYVLKPTTDSSTWQYTYPAQFEGQAMEENAFSIIRPKLTHSLFTSNIDLTGGILCSINQNELRVTIGDIENPIIDTIVLLPRSPNIFNRIRCSRQELIDLINEAVGEETCFALDSNGNQFVQIVSTRGPITLRNQERNPLGTFLLDGAGNDSSVSETQNALKVEGTAVVNISLDEEDEQTITFDGGYWTVELMVDTLQNSGIADNVMPYGKYIKIFGNSNDPAIAQVSISNSLESDINGVETFFGGYGDSHTSYLMRIERYKDIFHTDYYMIERGGVYKTIASDADGNHQIVSVGDDDQAQSLVVEEPVPETEPMRPCSSYEEAIFRNYQFFFAERKFLLILPLRLSLVGVEMATVYQVMEANGYTGFMYARKFRDNHEWAKKGADGESLIPGDYRLEICGDYSLLAGVLMSDETVYNDTLGCGTSFGAVLPHNAATIYRIGFPRAPKVNHGKDAFGEDILDYQIGSREFQVGDEIWNNRNALLIVLQALWGGLHENTEIGYEPVKGGMLPFFEMTTALLQPLFYFQKNQGEHPLNSWKPRLIDGHGALVSSADFYGDSSDMETWYGSEYERTYYRPAKIKSTITTLIDSDPYGEKGPVKRCDGLLPMVAEYDLSENGEPATRLITTLLDVLMKTGDTAFDDSPEIDYLSDDFDAGWESWGARRKLYYGIEQIISGSRLTKGRYTSINEVSSYKRTVYPDWMFATGIEDSRDSFGNYTEYENVRDEDLILDWGIDRIVGHNTINDANEGYGLAHYPDDKAVEADWEDFYDMADMLEALIHRDSDYSVTGPLLALLDETLAKPQPYTPDQIAGTLYTLGKIFAYYDVDEELWYHQGCDPENLDPSVDFNELYTILSKHLPAIHDIMRDETGQNYYASLVMLKELSKPGGMMEFLSSSVNVESDWEKIFEDIESFLGKDIVNNYEPMWSCLSKLTRDLAQAADEAQDGTLLNSIYESYGMQIN